MAPAKVSVVKCTEYSGEVLQSKILESLENIGFDPSVFKGLKVALKPNLLTSAPEEKAVITHPEFFRAVIKIVKENGGNPFLIESPAVYSPQTVIKRTGYAGVVKEEGIEVASLEPARSLSFEGAQKFKNVEIAGAFFDADIIVNVPKFKTHGLTYITGAVKNLFGAIPGLAKSKMHVKVPSGDDFSEFLLDLYGGMMHGWGGESKTILHIMDAIVAQEGEGPGPSGTPKPMNAIFAGLDAVAVDCVAVQAAGLDMDKALTVSGGFKREYCISSPDDIEFMGDPLSSLGNEPLDPSKGTIFSNMVRWPMTSKKFRNLFIDRPWPVEGKCTLCLQCKKICPAGVISAPTGAKKIPDYDHDKCIRCYCCMEVCPEAAIIKKRGMLQWVLKV